MSGLPLLLPEGWQPRPSLSSWQPKQHLLPPNAPPVDEGQVRDQEMAAQRQLMDGKALKKTRPRRTVDYAGGMGRWALVRSALIVRCAFRCAPSDPQTAPQPVLRAAFASRTLICYRRELYVEIGN